MLRTMDTDVHLVIPCFRESGRLGAFLDKLCPALTALDGVRILIVNDGGEEHECQKMDDLAASFRKNFPFILPVKHLTENIGKGGAVYAGWSEAGTARWVAFADADGSCGADEVARLIKLARAEDIANRAYLASRVRMLGRQVDRLWYRHLMGRIYATFVHLLLEFPAYDTQCGLKVVPRHLMDQIRDRLVVHRFAFDVELLIALRATGADLQEIPIDWNEIGGGKINLLTDSFRMLGELWFIRSRRKAGCYLIPHGNSS